MILIGRDGVLIFRRSRCDATKGEAYGGKGNFNAAAQQAVSARDNAALQALACHVGKRVVTKVRLSGAFWGIFGDGQGRYAYGTGRRGDPAAQLEIEQQANVLSLEALRDWTPQTDFHGLVFKQVNTRLREWLRAEGYMTEHVVALGGYNTHSRKFNITADGTPIDETPTDAQKSEASTAAAAALPGIAASPIVSARAAESTADAAADTEATGAAQRDTGASAGIEAESYETNTLTGVTVGQGFTGDETHHRTMELLAKRRPVFHALLLAIEAARGLRRYTGQGRQRHEEKIADGVRRAWIEYYKCKRIVAPRHMDRMDAKRLFAQGANWRPSHVPAHARMRSDRER